MRPTMKWMLALAFVLIAGYALFGQKAKGSKTFSVEEAHALIARDSTLLVLDVRTPAEFTGELGHIKNALLIPVQELESRLDEVKQYKGKTILVVCRSGRRSAIATEILNKNGFSAANVEGGMVKWNDRDLPVTK